MVDIDYNLKLIGDLDILDETRMQANGDMITWMFIPYLCSSVVQRDGSDYANICGQISIVSNGRIRNITIT